MLIKVLDEFEDWCVHGVGNVYTPKGSTPVTEYLHLKNPKLTFSLSTRVKKLIDANKPNGYTYSYETINCALYCNKTNSEMYALARTLQSHELVSISGKVYYQKIPDPNTGEEKIYTEVRIESLTLPNRMAKLLIGGDMSKKEVIRTITQKKEKSNQEDGYYF